MWCFIIKITKLQLLKPVIFYKYKAEEWQSHIKVSKVEAKNVQLKANLKCKHILQYYINNTKIKLLFIPLTFHGQKQIAESVFRTKWGQMLAEFPLPGEQSL